MRRISIVGSTGAGKTTLARDLSRRLGLPHVELDAIFWGPNWTQRREEFPSEVARAAAGDAWVIDGNYNGLGSFSIVWPRADTLIWLDYTLPRVLRQLVPRIAARIADRQEIWPGTGNRETIRGALFSKDMLWWFAIRTHRGRRRRIAAELTRAEYRHLAVHRFRHPRETAGWLSRIYKER